MKDSSRSKSLYLSSLAEFLLRNVPQNMSNERINNAKSKSRSKKKRK